MVSRQADLSLLSSDEDQKNGSDKDMDDDDQTLNAPIDIKTIDKAELKKL